MKNKAKRALDLLGDPRAQGAIALLGLIVAVLSYRPG